MYTHRFAVMGFGAFPLDMLRYDQCFPEQSSDGLHQDFVDKQIRTVRLMAYRDSRTWEPTKGRWSSFGWPVVRDSHVINKTPPP